MHQALLLLLVWLAIPTCGWAKDRHRAAPGQLDLKSPDQKLPTAGPVPARRSVLSGPPSKSKPAAPTKTPLGSLYENPAGGGQCSFSASTDFGLWSVRDMVVASDKSFYLLGFSQNDRLQTPKLVHLRTDTGNLAFPLGHDANIRALTQSASGEIAAITATGGLWFSPKGDSAQNWVQQFAQEKVHSFRWADGRQNIHRAWVVFEHSHNAQSAFQLVDFQTGGQLNFTKLQSNNPLELRDVSPSGHQVLLLQKHSAVKTELLYATQKGHSKVRTTGRVLEALFSQDEKNALVLEDTDGDGAKVWIYNLSTNKRRPLRNENLPVVSIAVAPDRSAVSIETGDWGARQTHIVGIDTSGAALSENSLPAVQSENIHTVRIQALAGKTRSILAWRNTLESADQLVRFENGMGRVLWDQKQTGACMKSWKRAAVLGTDGLAFIVDIFEPATKAAQQKAVLHVPLSGSQPHTPGFQSLRQYWLQNGWIVIEPHLRGSAEVGTNFLTAEEKSSWEQDIAQVVQAMDSMLTGSFQKRVLLSESLLHFRVLAGDETPNFGAFTLLQSCTSCSSLDVARQLQVP